MKAMVLAAGVGSRLEPLTIQAPKPLVPVANMPVMEHILSLLKQNGITDVYANLHYLPDPIRNYFGDGSRLGMNLKFHYEEELSGDAGGVRAMRSHLDDSTFMVLMGDTLTDADLNAAVSEHKRKKAVATIGLKRVSDVSHFGVAVLNKEGFIQGFQEKPKQEEALSDLASTGIYILEPQVFDHIPKNGQFGFGRQLFPQLVEKGLPVLGFEVDAYWSDVGTIAQYRAANVDALEQRIHVALPKRREDKPDGTLWLEDGVTVQGAVEVKGKALVGAQSTIGKGVKFTGSVVIGPNCTIEDNAHLDDCVIWANTRIKPNAQISDAVIGANCVIENGAKHVGVNLVPDLISRV